MGFVVIYLQSCAGGKLALSDCGPAWQLLVIVVLLFLAISTLVVLRLRSRPQVSNA